jgi:hypothetical protein
MAGPRRQLSLISDEAADGRDGFQCRRPTAALVGGGPRTGGLAGAAGPRAGAGANRARPSGGPALLAGPDRTRHSMADLDHADAILVVGVDPRTIRFSTCGSRPGASRAREAFRAPCRRRAGRPPDHRGCGLPGALPGARRGGLTPPLRTKSAGAIADMRCATPPGQAIVWGERPGAAPAVVASRLHARLRISARSRAARGPGSQRAGCARSAACRRRAEPSAGGSSEMTALPPPAPRRPGPNCRTPTLAQLLAPVVPTRVRGADARPTSSSPESTPRRRAPSPTLTGASNACDPRSGTSPGADAVAGWVQGRKGSVTALLSESLEGGGRSPVADFCGASPWT